MTRRITRTSKGASLLRPAGSNGLLRPAGLAVALTGAALCLSGCFYLSPDEVASYNSSDGISANVGSLQLTNVLIASSAKGAAGTLHGTATNPTQQAVQLTVTPSGGVATSVTVPPVTAVRLDGQPSGNTTKTAGPVPVTAVAAAPGASTQVTFATRTAGSVPVNVPVVLDTAPYGSATVSHATYDAPTSDESTQP